MIDTTRKTALETFTNTLDNLPELSEFTDKGMEAIRARVRAITPHLPAIILAGSWPDYGQGASGEAVEAAIDKADPNGEDEKEAVYYVGLLTGLVLADALRAANGGRHD